MNNEFQKELNRFADHLIHRMGENKAIQFMHRFIQIPSGNKLKNLVDALVLYTCQEYGINKDTFLYSTKVIHCYARITCYHIIKKHLKLSPSIIAGLFSKRKKDTVIDGVEKAQGMLDVPQYNPDFVAKYQSVEQQYINYTDTIQ